MSEITTVEAKQLSMNAFGGEIHYPQGAEFATIDRDGDVVAWTDRPKFNKQFGVWESEQGGYGILIGETDRVSRQVAENSVTKVS